MLSIALFGMSSIFGYFAYENNKYINELNEKKQLYSASVTTLDELKPCDDKASENKTFILKHTIPTGDLFRLISVNVERIKYRTIKYTEPVTYNEFHMTKIGNTCVPKWTKHTVPNSLILYEKNIVEKEMEHYDDILPTPNFGITFCGNQFRGFPCESPTVLIDSFYFFPQKTIFSDYGTVRDVLKEYGYTLSLDNVGKVKTTIIDCQNQTMYFGVRRIENSLVYESIGGSSRAIADDKYDDSINDAKTNRFSTLFTSLLLVAAGISCIVGTK